MKTQVIKMLKPKSELSDRHISDWDELLKVREFFRNQGQTVVVTSGTWDLLHAGQALYLHKAKSMGDVLIVGVDSDELTRFRKGPQRPIVPQDERITLLSLLDSVDFIALLDKKEGRDGESLIRMLKPDILVMSETTKNEGEDHATKWKGIYESEGICKVEILPPQSVSSTSNQIRLVMIEGRLDSMQRLLKFLREEFPDEFTKSLNHVENGKPKM